MDAAMPRNGTNYIHCDVLMSCIGPKSPCVDADDYGSITL